ncbi:MAG TPA: SLC13 family permease [Bryobacteraceae bacterium]|nr:SLC13 family permease [Bryobacteraceae bacterium]
MSTQVPPKPAAPATPAPAATFGSKVVKLAIAVVVGLAILYMPTPHGLSLLGQRVLAITGFTVALWVFQVLNNGIAAVLMMALMMAAGVKPPDALGGFSQGSWWILAAVLFYGCAMKNTGLAQRISYYILSLFPATYTGILSAFFVIGLILAMGIPSMTVRTAIMVPIAWAVVQSLELRPASKGSALIILTTVEMAVVPGVGLLLSSLNGPVIQSVFQAKNLPLSYFEYAEVMALPTLVICVLIIIANQIVLKPEAPLNVASGFAKRHLHSMGAMTRHEAITAIVVVISIVLWAIPGTFQPALRFLHYPSFVVGMFGLAVFGFAGIIKDSDMGTGVSWTLLLFIGGVFSLQGVVQVVKITDWLGGYFIPIALQMTSNPFLLIAVLSVSVIILRFIDPTGFIVIPVLFLPLVDVLMKAGYNPLVVVAPTTVASAPFFLSYQNFWIAMSEGLTGGKAFDGKQRFTAAVAYAVIVVAVLVLTVPYWKLIGKI